MILKNLVVLGITATVLLVYIFGIPSSFSAEYSKTRQYTTSANGCGNSDSTDSKYVSTAENIRCANTNSEIQGEENSIGITSSQR
jgi:hypothetical protein